MPPAAKMVTRRWFRARMLYLFTSFFDSKSTQARYIFVSAILRSGLLKANPGRQGPSLVYVTAPAPELAKLLRRSLLVGGYWRSYAEGNDVAPTTSSQEGQSGWVSLRPIAAKAIIATRRFLAGDGGAAIAGSPICAVPVEHQVWSRWCHASWLIRRTNGLSGIIEQERWESFPSLAALSGNWRLFETGHEELLVGGMGCLRIHWSAETPLLQNLNLRPNSTIRVIDFFTPSLQHPERSS